MALHISENLLEFIKQHAKSTYPYECCGFIYGTDDGENRSVHHVEKASNSRDGDQRRRFEISVEEYLHAERQAAHLGYDLIGIYHSHPDHPSEPSEHDRNQAVPFFSYVIASVKNGTPGTTQSWRLQEDRTFSEEAITTEPTEVLAHSTPSINS